MKLNPKIAKNLKITGFKLKKASPTILTIISVGGVVATAILSAKAAPKAVKLVEEGKKKEDLTDISKVELVAVNIKYGWKPFIPAIATAAGTIVCILGSNILNKKQQAALTSAYIMLENQYRDYRNKVIELHGEEEDKKIMSSIIKSTNEPISDYDETVTFAFYPLDRYFESTMANVSFAMQRANYYMLADGFVTLGQLMTFLGLEDEIEPEHYNVGWSDIWFLEGFGLPPVIEYRFIDKKNDDGMVIRHLDLWIDATYEALKEFDIVNCCDSTYENLVD